MSLSDSRHEIPDVISRILDELPAPVGVDYKPRMPSKKQKPRQNAYDWKNIKRPSWEKPPYDLVEIARASRVESYIRLSVDKHREHVLRHGWEYVSRNPRAKAYVERRLRELSESMGRPVQIEVRKAVKNFIKFSNFYLAWTRDRGFEYRSRYGKDRFRPTGLFSMNPTCMRYRRTAKNTAIEWYQAVEGHDDEQMKPVDVIHGAFDQDEGIILGVPFILPVLDDIQTWRRFEEMAEILGHKFAYPLYHHRIGDKDRDPEEYDDGTNEIGEAASIVAGMAPEGHLFTSYRHEIEVIGAGTKAIDLKPYIEYWEARVLAGLNLSVLDIGRGDTTTRNTAETLSKGLADRCAEYQEEFALYFTFYVLDELLLEGGFELSAENRVFMHFPPIDREAKRAEETHNLLLYQGQAITHEEMRIRLGLEPFSDENWKDTYLEQVTLPTIEEGKVDPAAGQGSTAAVTNKAKPTNQHGTKATKTKVKRDSLRQVLSQYKTIGDPALRASLVLGAKMVAEKALRIGIDDYNREYGSGVYLGQNIIDGFVVDCVEPGIDTVLASATSPLAALPSLDFYLVAFQTAGRHYGYARAAQIDTRRSAVRWRLSETACDLCAAEKPMRIRRFTLGQMLPRHSDCCLGLEVADQMSHEEYLREETRVIRAGHLNSFVNMRVGHLPDTAFCGPGRTFIVDDEVTALTALRILASTRKFSLAVKAEIRQAIGDRMIALGFTVEEAEERVTVLLAGAEIDYDEQADVLDEVRAVTAGQTAYRLPTAQRTALDEREFAGPNRTFPLDSQQSATASLARLDTLQDRLPAEILGKIRRRLEKVVAAGGS